MCRGLSIVSETIITRPLPDRLPMIFTRRHLLQSAGLVLASPIVSRSAVVPACAQSWPNRHVQLVVPFTAGGGTDSVARIVGQKLSELWRQQVIVENRSEEHTSELQSRL